MNPKHGKQQLLIWICDRENKVTVDRNTDDISKFCFQNSMFIISENNLILSSILNYFFFW